MYEFREVPTPDLLGGALRDLPPVTSLLLLAMVVLAGIILIRVAARLLGLIGPEPLNEDSPWGEHHRDPLDD